MKCIPRRLGSTIVLALLLTACGPGAASPAPTALPELDSTPSPDVPMPTVVPTDLPGVPIPPDTNVLILLEGEARLTRDNGTNWTATGTGQYLQTGDEIQTSDDALALVFLLNGAVVRLEGPSDLQIMRAERDGATGATKIIVKLWDGYGLFDTNPLPTPDSLFQFHVMTTFVNLEYDAALAAETRPGTALDPERSVIAGGLLNEETERLYHFRGPASLFLLDQLNGVTFAAELPTAPEETADLEAAFLDDYELEAELEAFGVTAGYLIAECKLRGSCEGVDISGNTVSHVEELETGQTLYFFGGAPAAAQVSSAALFEALGDLRTLAALQAQAAAGPGSGAREVTMGRMAWGTTADLPGWSRSPAVAEQDVFVLVGDLQDFGCNPISGSGCLPPQGCDLPSGVGCELRSGCNAVTASGCQPVEIAFKVWVVDPTDSFSGYHLEYPAAIDPGCTPNTPGDCDRAYHPEEWIDREELDEDEVAACWCPANPPPPGYGPPPPGTFMYYRCFCSDPGAMRDRPSQ